MLIQTYPSEDIRDFISYYEAACGRSAAADREGASPQEIELFQQSAVHPFPLSYRGYLQEFGRRDGILEMGGNRVYSITGLIGYYQRETRSTSSRIPPESVVIAVPAIVDGLCLLYSEPAVDGFGPVVAAQGLKGSILYTAACSFPNYLYSAAFDRSKAVKGTVTPSAWYKGHDLQKFQKIEQYAREIGFDTYWFSNNQPNTPNTGQHALLGMKTCDGTVFYFYHPIESERLSLRREFKTHFGLL